MKKRSLTMLSVTVALALLLGSLPLAQAAEEGAAYTRYNIHVQGKADRKGNMAYDASYANWTDPGEGHSIVPPNTLVKAEKGGSYFWEKGSSILVMNPDQLTPPIGKIFFEFDPKRMQMSFEDYFALITSPTPVSLDQYSPKDREGIKEGKALNGMTKKGVVAALGYPAVHETPSLDAASYIYWRNRLTKVRVDFNDAGTVISVK